MDNCTYNKLKLMHELSKIKGFIDKFGKKDAKKNKHHSCDRILIELRKDLVKHMKALHKAVDPEKL